MSDEKPKGEHSVLTYHVGQKLDVLHLGELVDGWHSLICGYMPGAEIESITYGKNSYRLVVTFS